MKWALLAFLAWLLVMIAAMTGCTVTRIYPYAEATRPDGKSYVPEQAALGIGVGGTF